MSTEYRQCIERGVLEGLKAVGSLSGGGDGEAGLRKRKGLHRWEGELPGKGTSLQKAWNCKRK